MITRKIHNIIHPKLGRIYMLHSINSTEYLEKLVEQCRKEGFEPISMDEAVERLKNHKRQKFACFTFDDGYLDTYTLAYPILQKLEVPFCIYMTRDFYRGMTRPQWDEDAQMMNAEQLKAISKNPLCTIGVHTCTHPHLSTLTAEEQRKEIADCKTDLNELLGIDMRHLAYPHGDYNQTTVEIAVELGFHTAVTTSGRHVRNDSKPLELDRVFVK